MAGVPQNDQEIFACYIEEDGLETVKNQGRQDIKNRWESIENNWIDIISKQSGSETIQWLKPSKHLSYQMPKEEFEIYEEDFSKSIIKYFMFENNIDEKELNEILFDKVLYKSSVKENTNGISILLKSGEENE